MSENEILRRASYGPTSPVVGARGTRTRARIVTAALDLFESQGFHGTSVDEIATAAGVSRATLYQYFESKETIFVELLNECGGALMRVVRRIGPLGPTALGFDNLHWWLGEWAWVYDKYATMFVQWANVDSPRTSVRPMISGFLESYYDRIAERLVSSQVEGIDPIDAAMTLTTLVNRFNYFRHSGFGDGQPAEKLVDNLAVVLQLILFPHTPASAFAQLGTEAAGSAHALRPMRRSPLAAVPSPPVPEVTERFASLSPRASATVRQILDAGIQCFAERGYHLSFVDDIVATAGLARGTFYKYFDEKLDLLLALSAEASAVSTRLGVEIRGITLDPAGLGRLRGWLADFVAFHLRYVGVTRTWIESAPQDPRLDVVRRQVGHEMWADYAALLEQVERTYPLDLDVAGLVFFCLLERLPDTAVNMVPAKTPDEAAALLGTVIERGLLNGRPIGHAAA
ncbi:TetR/AcrR family transcriptional regulator [Frankia sp. AiPs1]|uniref:TetR/AcrR family transcriptional regulator n=1 Tax=Frankia sp. AiPs1 TaxID=573493 RepID=UPI002042FE91|nr:TetR/AcrR family transcriptional regulator [Frankia sp. AiPs1]MCM3923860.1 TetR/AcrR family transcriptional regulator [Frankia sp. AiPs1]